MARQERHFTCDDTEARPPGTARALRDFYRRAFGRGAKVEVHLPARGVLKNQKFTRFNVFTQERCDFFAARRRNLVELLEYSEGHDAVLPG
jgi:hypothetical protein